MSTYSGTSLPGRFMYGGVAGGAALGTWITLTSSPGSSDGGSGILGLGAAGRELGVAFCSGGDFRLARLGAEVTEGKAAVMVTGRAGVVTRCRSSGRSGELFSGDFLEELMVDRPESLELRVEEGKSTLVSRKPAQI